MLVVHESFPLARPFRIARGVKTSAELVVVEVRHTVGGQDFRGRGECVPYARYDESVASVTAQLESVRAVIEEGSRHDPALARQALQRQLPAGAARNALDAALWDLQSKITGCSVAALLGLPAVTSAVTAQTVSLDTPAHMAEAAMRLSSMSLLKVKVDGHDPLAQVAAVRAAAPAAKLIVDANEGWSMDLLRQMQQPLSRLGVALIEQPLPAERDDCLERFTPLIPICADESCHTLADLPTVRKRYQAVNLKLDKCGGLTAAIDFAGAVRSAKLQLMVGCMVCSSLGIAPALVLAEIADFVDLDGPLLLARDRHGGVLLQDGRLQPPQPGFWGDPSARMLG